MVLFVPTDHADGIPSAMVAVRYRDADWANTFREHFTTMDPDAFCREDISKTPEFVAARGWFDASNEVYWCQKRRKTASEGPVTSLEIWKREGPGILMLEGLIFEGRTAVRESDYFFPVFSAYGSRQTVGPLKPSIAPAPARDALADVAKARMKDSGWTEVRVVGWVRRGYEKWLVVEMQDILRKRYATKDVPFTLSELDMEPGTYWAKTTIVGGVDEIVDGKGKEHSLRFATWKAVE